jgi:GNAT superfamily N-acetyltransferase
VTTTPERGTNDDNRIWYRELGSTASGLRIAEAWESAAHADGEYSSDEPGDARLVWRLAEAERGLVHVEIPEERAPGAPALWFVAVDEPRGQRPACNLVAYSGADVTPGTIVSSYTFATLGVRSDAQLGAVRWYRDGLVHQIYVSPQHRRQNIGTSLLHAAGAWQQANRWPGFIHSDGRRTLLGQLFLAAKRNPGRIRDLSETMPDMDPDAVGR